MGNISHKTLSATLKEMEADRLIVRKEYPQIPPKVEYSLSERGKSLVPVLVAMCKWGGEHRHGKQITDEIQAQIFEAIGWLEEYSGKKFGDTQDPLLVSVRSGARASMPGMMDTILNLGLMMWQLGALRLRQVTQDLRMIHIEDLYRCSQMLLWKFLSHILRRL